MAKIKPGTPHPTKGGLVMGMNGRYVAKGTYNRQKANASKPATKPASQKPKVQTKSSPSTPKVGATKRLQGRMVRWNGKRWTAAGTGPKQPAPTPRKADATPKPPTGNFKAPKIPKPKTSPSAASTASKVVSGASKLARGAGKLAGGAGLVAGGLSTANDLRKSLKRGEGYAALGKLNREANKGNTGRSGAKRRAALRVKPSSTKPKYPTTAVTKTVKKSRDYQAEAKAKSQSQAKSKPAKDRGKRDYGSKEKNMAAWRKANPALAKALDKRNAAKAKRLEESKKKRAKKRAGGTLYSGRTGMSNMA